MRRQRFGQERAGAAAGVQNVDIFRRQAVGYAQVVLESPVDAGHHVAHHLGGGVPNAELLAQGRVEGLQERLVEVGDGLTLVELGEEGLPVHPVQRGGGPVQHLDEAQRLQLAGVGKLLEKGPQHGSAQVPDCFMPVEWAGGGRRLARPENP